MQLSDELADTNMDLRKGAEYVDYVKRVDEKFAELELTIQKFQNKYPYPSEVEQGWMWDLLIPQYELALTLAGQALNDGFPDLARAVLARADRLKEIRSFFYTRWNAE